MMTSSVSRRGRRFGRTSPMHATKRLFVALDLPPSCKGALLALDPHLPGLRWLPGDQLHLTLSFLGNVDAAGEERLREALGGARVPAFYLRLCGTGMFSARGRPSVLWVGVGKGHPHLFVLHRRILDAVLHAGLDPELKPFHPHVTVARAKGISREALKPFLREHAEVEFGLFEVNGFSLYSSVLSEEGSAHHLEMRQEF